MNSTLLSGRVARMLLSLAAALAAYLLLPADCPEAARRTAAVFVLAAFFWALEIIPLYATSLSIVILLIFLLAKPGGVLGMNAGGYRAFLMPFASPVVILFFGGFMLAEALHKHELDRALAKGLLRLFGTRPFMVLLGFMATTGFLSMWLSNTATTAIMITLVRPLLSDIRSHFAKAIVLGVAFSANIGGMGTPVGTPPNAIALGILAENGIRLGFVGWMAMAVPLVVLLILGACVLLYLCYRPSERSIEFRLSAGRMRPEGRWVVGVSLLTVGLWLTSSLHHIPDAVTALLAAGLFVFLGVLDKDDIKRLDWDILLLMWGGLSLGTAMEVSGLTGWLVSLPLFSQSGLVLLALFVFLAVFLSTFMSNTAAANLLIPVAMGAMGENSLVLVAAVAMSCSLAMALPVSTPPNALAFSSGAIKGGDMFKTGLAISVVSSLLVLGGIRWAIPLAFSGRF